jgi:hypothetical protein
MVNIIILWIYTGSSAKTELATICIGMTHFNNTYDFYLSVINTFEGKEHKFYRLLSVLRTSNNTNHKLCEQDPWPQIGHSPTLNRIWNLVPIFYSWLFHTHLTDTEKLIRFFPVINTNHTHHFSRCFSHDAKIRSLSHSKLQISHSAEIHSCDTSLADAILTCSAIWTKRSKQFDWA